MQAHEKPCSKEICSTWHVSKLIEYGAFFYVASCCHLSFFFFLAARDLKHLPTLRVFPVPSCVSLPGRQGPSLIPEGKKKKRQIVLPYLTSWELGPVGCFPWGFDSGGGDREARAVEILSDVSERQEVQSLAPSMRQGQCCVYRWWQW